ncbi:tyrosine-type recombinase/integrase [Vagococcus fluvialis]|uniref:tyrosine-type recombinase/integrase n=1 Tax=Vagococcus fluvialis TaxID=2738 RepID=UPI001D0B4DAD|nr:site-specific integrase [Vagococcus fluvialis]UDM72729.1 integrase [Vagococcus fluvialis]UDM78451.1 integrase [Vagococcus fluvialis]UDM84004.1 integrase [Vagococcus fluvialis]
MAQKNGTELKFDTKGRAKTVRYATAERKAKISEKNKRAYAQYLRTSKIKNEDVTNTTYKVYESYFNIFLCYIAENWDNFDILDEEYLEDNMIDVMEEYMIFLKEELNNAKKSINTKISAVSSFYVWAAKRRKIKAHPFDGRLERMKGAQDEKIIAEYFLTDEQVKEVVTELSLVDEEEGLSDYDKMDQLIWHIAFDSACRIGALSNLKVSSFSEEKEAFTNIREKRGKLVSVPMTPSTHKKYLEFIELREKLGVDCDELFYVRKGGKWAGMSTQSLYARIKKMGYIVGLGDFRPHCIRKTRLNQVAKHDINKAKLLANHESLDTTSRFYTEKEDQSDVLESIMALESKGEE